MPTIYMYISPWKARIKREAIVRQSTALQTLLNVAVELCLLVFFHRGLIPPKGITFWPLWLTFEFCIRIKSVKLFEMLRDDWRYLWWRVVFVRDAYRPRGKTGYVIQRVWRMNINVGGLTPPVAPPRGTLTYCERTPPQETTPFSHKQAARYLWNIDIPDTRAWA